MGPVYGRASFMALAATVLTPVTQSEAERRKEVSDAVNELVDNLHFPKIPKRLDIRTDSRQKCKLYDVFLDGVQQRACIVADAGRGFILRYKLAIGSMPVKGRSGHYDTESVQGKVEIKLKAPESV